MPEDRSLDEFAGDDETAGPAPADADGADAEDADDPDANTPDADDSDAVDPATATSTWHADGSVCDRCGDRVERRWRDGDAFVCSDCASW